MYLLFRVRRRLGGNGDFIGNQEVRVEANTELTDQIARIGTLLKLVDKLLGARFGDGTEILDELIASHTNALVHDVQLIVLLVNLDLN